MKNRPVRDRFLPFHQPSIDGEEIQEVVDTLKSGWITTGPKTKLFEKKFQEYIGCKHAIAVSSCTAGLHLALVAAGIGQGDSNIFNITDISVYVMTSEFGAPSQLEKIDMLEKSKIESQKYIQKSYYFEFPLFVAFLSLLFYTFLLNKRGSA